MQYHLLKFHKNATENPTNTILTNDNGNAEFENFNRASSNRSHDEDFSGFLDNENQDSSPNQNEGRLVQCMQNQNIPDIDGELQQHQNILEDHVEPEALHRNPLKRKIRSSRAVKSNKKIKT